MRAVPVRWARRALIVGAVGALVATLMADPANAAATTTQISANTAGAPSNGASQRPGLSDDCRFVTFISSATNLVPQGPSNSFNDVFIRDRQSGTIEQISVDSHGNQGGFDSGGFEPAAVTPDGRLVAFSAFTGTLVPGDTNQLVDIFVRDRTAHTTVRVSVASDGTQANGSSAVTGISADGRYVVFNSRATNLVPVDANGIGLDVFVHDMVTGATTLASVRKDGSQVDKDTRAWDVSNDGRYVLFESYAKYNPTDNGEFNAFVKDLRTGTVEPASVDGSGREFASGTNSQPLSMSADGRMVAFEGAPPNQNYQIYVRDRTAKTTTLVSVNLQGRPANFGSSDASISADGRYVAFTTGADNLVTPAAPPYSNTYVRDLTTRRTVLASVTSTGAAIQQSTGGTAMCNGGVAFTSYAPNVVPGSNTTVEQVYFRSN
jgi:archaellum component FlaF (FlaF/FlaG flagellin family)